MFKLFLAILLALASPAQKEPAKYEVQTLSTEDDDPPPNEYCPFGVEDCVCTYPGFTGGDTGHIPNGPPF